MAEPTLTDKVNKVLHSLSQDIVEQKLELPTPPDTLLELKKLAQSPEVKIKEIVRLLRRDPSISARLIKVGNSVLFGSRNHVTSVKSAVLRLGMKNVHNLVVGLTLTQQFLLAKAKVMSPYLTEAWEQSRKVAAISQALAYHKTDIDPDNALLAGLIHNIGMLPLYLRLSRISDLRDDPELLHKTCQIVVPKLYAKAGAMITKSWNFSDEFINVTAKHDQVQSISDGPIQLADIVVLAHQIYQVQKSTESNLFPEELVNSTVFQKFWPDAIAAQQDLEKYAEEIADTSSFINQ